jgi:hypothetical protein
MPTRARDRSAHPLHAVVLELRPGGRRRASHRRARRRAGRLPAEWSRRGVGDSRPRRSASSPRGRRAWSAPRWRGQNLSRIRRGATTREIVGPRVQAPDPLDLPEHAEQVRHGPRAVSYAVLRRGDDSRPSNSSEPAKLTPVWSRRPRIRSGGLRPTPSACSATAGCGCRSSRPRLTGGSARSQVPVERASPLESRRRAAGP